MGGSDTTASTDQKGHWVAGFDAGTPTPTDDGLFKQTRDEETANTTTTYGRTENGTDAITYGKETDTTREGSHTLHAHGNIGVTTTQKLIKEQRQIDLFNLYDIIIESFKMRFCIMVY